MKVILAGASGAVGTPLTRQLIAAGHQVVGITRSQANAERLRDAGAEAVVADVMDREGLLAAVRGVRADAVMHQLTALGTKKPCGTAMQAHERAAHHRHRPPARGRPGGRRPPLPHPVDRASGTATGITATARDHRGGPVRRTGARPDRPRIAAMRSTEEQVFSAGEMEGIALRYGLFYGPDSFTRMIIDMVRKRPVAGALLRRRARQLHLPGGRRRRDRGRPGEGARRARRTTSSTASRCAGPISWTRWRRLVGARPPGGCPGGCCGGVAVACTR